MMPIRSPEASRDGGGFWRHLGGRMLSGFVIFLLFLGAATAAAESPVGRCINFSNALEAPVEGDWGFRIVPGHLDVIRDAGFDTVRLPVRFSAHTEPSPPYRISKPLLERVDTVIGLALVRGLNVILDLHHFEALMADPDAQADRAVAIWETLATRYRSAPPGLIFELLNEPNGALTPERLTPLNAAMLAAIRRIDPDRWVVIGGSPWNALDALEVLEVPQDPKLILGFHYYKPFAFTHQGADFIAEPPPTGQGWGGPADVTRLLADMVQAGALAGRKGMPVLMGEFGVHVAAPRDDRLRWIRSVRQSAEAAGIGWCHWGFGSAFGAFDQAADRWDAGVLDALMAD